MSSRSAARTDAKEPQQSNSEISPVSVITDAKQKQIMISALTDCRDPPKETIKDDAVAVDRTSRLYWAVPADIMHGFDALARMR